MKYKTNEFEYKIKYIIDEIKALNKDKNSVAIQIRNLNRDLINLKYNKYKQKNKEIDQAFIYNELSMNVIEDKLQRKINKLIMAIRLIVLSKTECKNKEMKNRCFNAINNSNLYNINNFSKVNHYYELLELINDLAYFIKK